MSESDLTRPGSGRDGACAAHPERPGVFDCLRCGDYACDACRAPGFTHVCIRCFDKLGLTPGFQLHRDSWTPSNVMAYAGIFHFRAVWSVLLPFVVLMASAYPVARWVAAELGIPLAVARLPVRALALGLALRVGFRRLRQLVVFYILRTPSAVGLLRSPAPGMSVALALGAAYGVVTVSLRLLPGFPGTRVGGLAVDSIAMTLVLLVALEVAIAGPGTLLSAVASVVRHASYRPAPFVGTVVACMGIAWVSLGCVAPMLVGFPFALLSLVALYLAARTPAPGAG